MKFRSICSQCLSKELLLKILQISQESICVRVFFNKIANPQKYNFIKKWLQHRYFLCQIYKIFKNTLFTEHLRWVLLTVSGFQPVTLLRKKLLQRWFSVNFSKCLKTSFDRIPAGDWTPLLQSTSSKLLISCTSCRISTSQGRRKDFYDVGAE